ncbi:MAG TPA: polysaccharide biosynthesis/export family protein [Pyrinomonadaceae bacterium]|nr:polysaccharide biosynthesis/export family protein [Pyrinomonadaceae bacterium]
MKYKILFATLLTVTFACAANAQGQTVTTDVAANSDSNSSAPASTRARVSKSIANSAKAAERSPVLQAHASNDLSKPADGSRLRRASEVTNGNQPAPAVAATPTMLPPVALASAQVYRVGTQDVLDIQLAGNPSRESTLFTVMPNGLLEYPLAGGAITAAGLTTNEIASLLRQRIKFIENPTVKVTVRDYASHFVTINGFVSSPGKKVLRREAIPLYALLAESLVLPEAARATITRQGRPTIVADLKDPNHTATLIVAGDVIKVSGVPAAPTEFFYIGGAINSPGQKPFHAGITLTQALLASGGTSTKAADTIRVSRLGANGRLIAEEYSLRKVQGGRIADPVLQKGDRIEVYSVN